jgi:hypothetical protein
MLIVCLNNNFHDSKYNNLKQHKTCIFAYCLNAIMKVMQKLFIKNEIKQWHN